jgi:HEAT repeat protein
MIARTFAWNKVREEIEQIDYFVIWEDEAIPAARLRGLSGLSGGELIEAMEDLAAMLYAPAAKVLLGYLDDGDSQVRAAAAKALGMISNAEVAGQLMPYLTGDDPVVARHCARALEGAMPKSLEKAVAKLLKDDSVAEGVRFHLVGALEFHGDGVKAGEAFLSVLKDASVSGQLRNRLGYSLVQVADAKLVKGMIKQFRVEESPYVTLSLASALNRATGSRRPISGNSPIGKSKPGKRGRYIEKWQK